ncbi:hypothetical protein EON67_06095 [archaeon]|nr:MAG: hypothetical protein EON67_06095 [archaeon]
MREICPIQPAAPLHDAPVGIGRRARSFRGQATCLTTGMRRARVQARRLNSRGGGGCACVSAQRGECVQPPNASVRAHTCTHGTR